MPSSHTAQGRICHHITNKETTVYECLAQHFKLDKRRVDELFSLGSIYSNKLRVTTDRKLVRGAYLRIHLQPKRFTVSHIDWTKRILFENNDFIVANKPVGVPVHATVDNTEENVLQQLRHLTKKNLLVTQRLDVPVAGLLVFAKNNDFQRKFNRWLGENKIQKTYTALCEGTVPLGLKVHYMEPSERSPKTVMEEVMPGWQRCELTVLSCVSEAEKFSKITIQLHTGRTHQIRVQLAKLGNPILGDRMYGSRVTFEPGSIALCATAISWFDKEPWKFEIEAGF